MSEGPRMVAILVAVLYFKVSEVKKLTGDSLFYDRILGYGEAFDNVQMNDTVNRNMLTGDYCFYNESHTACTSVR